MGVPIKYHNGTDWVLIDAGAIVDSNGNRITADNITNHFATDGTLLQKGHVQLSSATNSTDETVAATSKAVKDVKDASIPLTQKDAANGVATLDANGKLTGSQKGISIKTGSISNGGTIPQTAGYTNYMYFASVSSASFSDTSTGEQKTISCSVNQSTRVVSVSFQSGGTANYLEIAW